MAVTIRNGHCRWRAFLSAGILLTASVAIAPAAFAADVTRCTISGTARADSLRGTAGRDVICGFGGNDTINGLGGDDVINGGSGNDVINGGSGDDVLNGDAGADRLSGADGDDTSSGGTGNDRIDGGAGDDTLSGSDGDDTVAGADGDDALAGDVGNDVLSGGRGADSLDGGIGSDSAQGGDGGDSVQGGTGDDRLRGDAGDDVIWGSGGADSLTGGAGNDALQGGPARDNLATGGGIDQCAMDSEDPVTGRCQTDSSGPALTVVSAPTEVAAGQTLRFEWRAADPAGIQSTQVSIGGRSGWITNWCGFQVVGSLVSGDDRDGIYSFECEIPADAPSQEYTMVASASDNFGVGADVAGANFTVVGGSSDISTPTISAVQFPASANRGELFTLRWRSTDETAVNYAYAWVNYNIYNVVNVTTMKTWVEYVEAPRLVSGDTHDGVWEQSFTFRDDSPAGIYTFWFSLSDTLGNRDYQQTSYTIAVLP